MSKCKCGSYAINHHLHGRDGSDGDLCDVCYWRKRAKKISEAEYIIGAFERGADPADYWREIAEFRSTAQSGIGESQASEGALWLL